MCDEPALCVQQIHVAKEIKFRSRYMMFVCHKLRSSYVTSILITKITFAMFLLKLSTLSATLSLVLSLLFVLLYSHVVQACLFRIK